MENLLFQRQAAMHLDALYTVLRKNNIKLSKNESSKIVGSRSVLERLVATGKIRMVKRKNIQAGKWDCNAEDVFRYANYKERTK